MMFNHTSIRKTFSVFISLAVAVVLLAGCNLPNVATSTPIPLPTDTPVPLDSPTAVPPSPTPQPSVTATPTATNIVFATGTTAAVEQGTIQPGQVITYSLSAGQYQPMVLILNSPANDVYLGVLEPDGNKLLDPAHKWIRWQWLLPKTEVYTIQVFGGATAESYTLTAKVAQRVNFGSGSSSITLNGTTVNGFVFSYALSCKASQTMTVTLNVAATSAYLDVFGLATGPQLNAASMATTWTGTLPSTEDYIIEVIPNGGQVVNYTLTISVH
jgi:hypothetical protein